MYDFTQLIQFMREYVRFFEEMSEKEKEKLDALLSYDLKKMERSISDQQAIEMKLQNMEKKREEMQGAAKVQGKTFREIVELAPLEQKQVLQELFQQMQELVDGVQYYNGKSMEFVKQNMQTLKRLGYRETENNAGMQGYTQAGQLGGWSQQKTVFQKKV